MWRSTDDGCTSASSSGSMTMRPEASASRIERSERITGRDSTDGLRTPPSRRASMPPVLRRFVTLVLLVLGLVAATAGAASAHTGWTPDAVAPGTVASLTLSVERWIADWPAGAPEPEMPGPVLKREPGAAGDIPPANPAPSTTTSQPATTAITAPAKSDDDGGDSTGLIIGAVALFLVAVGVT